MHYSSLQFQTKVSLVKDGTVITCLLHYVSSCVSTQVDVIVTSAGGIEEDFIKCLAPTYVGDFRLSGKDLRQKGLNRIGNLIAPNNNYIKFEDWMMPLLDDMLLQQKDNVRQTRWRHGDLLCLQSIPYDGQN